MKKLLAILLSVLILCSVIPFAAVSVSAEDEPTIELVVEETELNAGDEFEVTVNLLNIPEPGLIGIQVEIDYDHNVFELVTNYDEDEEMWLPAIEVGSKYNASSNKYITAYSPIDEETGLSKSCLVQYLRATAKENQVRYEEHFYTATFRVKDDAVSGDYALGIANYNPKNIVRYGNLATEMATTTVDITVNGQDPEPPVCEHEYEYDCSKVCSKCGEETRPEAEHQYFYACEQYCMLCNEKTNPRAKHNILHIEAKAPVSCIEYGNVEYWYCEHCYHAWLDEACTDETNMKRVILAGECISNAPACQDGECINCTLPCYAEAEHTYANAHDASCDVCGTIRELVLKAEDIIIAGGTSVSEKKNGLAFKFDAAINGITWNEEYTADYSNATVTIEGVEYKLVGMGVIANNKGYESQTAEDVDGKYVLNVPAVKVYEDAEGNTSYSIRVLNIPADKLDAEITVRSYYQYEVDGEIVTVYGQDWSSSYNDAR